MPSTGITLTTDERTTLERVARERKGRADLATRAQAILWLADGASYTELNARLGWSSRTTATWKQRFIADRLEGLRSRHKGSKPRVLTPGWKHGFSRGLGWRRPTARPTGVPVSWRRCCTSPTRWSRRCGSEPG